MSVNAPAVPVSSDNNESISNIDRFDSSQKANLPKGLTSTDNGMI